MITDYNKVILIKILDRLIYQHGDCLHKTTVAFADKHVANIIRYENLLTQVQPFGVTS